MRHSGLRFGGVLVCGDLAPTFQLARGRAPGKLTTCRDPSIRPACEGAQRARGLGCLQEGFGSHVPDVHDQGAGQGVLQPVEGVEREFLVVLDAS